MGDKTDTSFTVTSSKNKVVVTLSPLRLDFYSHGVLTLSANARQLLRFEATKEKTEENNQDEAGTWEESFGGNTDSKPNGPQAVAMDFTFVDAKHVYGIPEHADRFSLVDTSHVDPYRYDILAIFRKRIIAPALML